MPRSPSAKFKIRARSELHSSQRKAVNHKVLANNAFMFQSWYVINPDDAGLTGSLLITDLSWILSQGAHIWFQKGRVRGAGGGLHWTGEVRVVAVTARHDSFH